MNMQLRATREACSKTQKQVAVEANVAERMYQEYEYNKSQPNVRIAIRIAKVLNSTVETLFGIEGEK